MGDRGNVFFVDGGSSKRLEGIYFYTHWSGGFLPATLRAALVRGQNRWGDAQYLARIIFCEMVADQVMEETGFGLSTQIGDNEHLIIRVDGRKQQVSFHKGGTERNPRDMGTAHWSYSDYVAAGDEALLAAFAPTEDEGELALPEAKAAKATKATKASTAKPTKRGRSTKKPASKAKSKRA